MKHNLIYEKITGNLEKNGLLKERFRVIYSKWYCIICDHYYTYTIANKQLEIIHDCNLLIGKNKSNISKVIQGVHVGITIILSRSRILKIEKMFVGRESNSCL